MIRLVLAALGFCTLIGGPAQAQPVDPLALAREGRLSCFTPDLAAKTCRAMGAYSFHHDGSIESEGVVIINFDPLIVMTITAPVYVRDEMVCRPLRLADLDGAVFEIEGAPATAEQTNALRVQMRARMAPMEGEICSAYVRDGDGFTSTGYFNGRRHSGLDDRMIWVRPEDGYTVAAPDASAT